MIRIEHFTFPSHDGRTQIHAVQWIPEVQVEAVLQISHGMVEYMERYDAFARNMADHGILVTGNDHLGHGKSIRERKDYGYFAEKNGNGILLKDIHRLRKLMQNQHPDVPYFFLGHSMGSFLVRQYLCIHGEGLAGAVIMGTGHKPRFLVQIGMGLCKVIAGRHGWHYRSKFIDAMAFGGYTLTIPSRRTDWDWLTKDEQMVDDYIRNEHCQFMFSLNGYYNLFLSIYRLSFPKYLRRMPKKLPVFFVSGAKDPVGNSGRGVKKAVRQFGEAGMQSVHYKLYANDRHEILNELDRDCVYRDIYRWLLYRMPARNEE